MTMPTPEFPACWSWPVTTGDLDQVQAVANPHMAWVLLSRWQQDRCGICGCTPEQLDADHDHVTRLARGYLCRLCNVREAKAPTHKAGDDLYSRYRLRHPARMLGLRLRWTTATFAEARVGRESADPGHLLQALARMQREHNRNRRH